MSPRKLLMVGPSDDKTVPKAFVGEQQPNYYCRAWNGKREKYCRARAGNGTDHKGIGRCKHHGGRNQNAAAMKHGRYAKIVHPAVQKLIEQHEKDTRSVKDKMLAALNHTLALRDEALRLYAEKPTPALLDQIVGHNEVISKSGYRLEQIRSHGTVSVDRIKVFLSSLALAIDQRVTDPDMRRELRKDVNALRI